MMRRVVIGVSLFCCLIVSPGVRCQSKGVDLSGNWALDKSKSEKLNSPLWDSENSMVVTQHNPEIKMVHKFSVGEREMELPSIYYSDGRDESFQTPFNIGPVQARTKWDGDKLVTLYITRRIVVNRMLNMDVVEEWKLAKDGKTLTQKLIFIPQKSGDPRAPNSGGRTEIRRVYNRVS